MNTRQGLLLDVTYHGSIVSLTIETDEGTATYFGELRLTNQALSAMGLQGPDDLPARVSFTADGADILYIGLEMEA